MAAREPRWRTSPQLWGDLKPLAREMRHQPTAAEDKLWQALRRKKVDGLHFHRQHAINQFVVDFYCAAAKLVVELDGPVHVDNSARDAERTRFLEGWRLRVLRFDNARVIDELDSVLAEIREAISTSPPSPSPSTERGTEGVRS